MKACHTILSACLVPVLQVLLTGSLSDPHPGFYRDNQWRLSSTGLKSPLGDLGVDQTIKIGLLIQDKNSKEALQASELAILNANIRNGYKGVRFELVVRSMEGPWGTGSKQAVSLVFDENVVAMLGSHDGRNAHLVEQVAAKSRVVFISAWSGDPTLSQAFVPWFFNSVFNYNQQSDALFREIFINKKLNRIAVVCDDSYDSGSMLRCFLEQIKSHGKTGPFQIEYNRESKNIRDVLNKLKGGDFDCLVLFAEQPSSLNIIEQMRLNNLQQPVYCSMNQLDEDEFPGYEMKPYENVIFVSPLNFSSKAGISFREEYRKKFGTYPGVIAACAFDGMNLLIEAIRKAGTGREKLEEELKEIKYEGVTGLIQFDDKGNRKGTPGLVVIKNGVPVQMK
jgi:branched-chain amino acid transport system substrate-binding protein